MESKVKLSLFNLLQSYVPQFTIDDIDDIVLGYVVGILEDIVEENSMEAFDAETFKEMLTAYLPESEEIPIKVITSWMFDLSEEVRTGKKKEKNTDFDIKMIINNTTNMANAVNKKKTRSISETSEDYFTKKRNGRLSETSDGGSEDNNLEDDLVLDVYDASLETLVEMFPSSCQVEALHCLTTMGGDLERAAQLMINRMEMGQEIKPNHSQMLAKLTKKVALDDKEVKKKIMGNYGFVDKEEDGRYHRPTLRKGIKDDKKLTRYRDGKIVSTKGERFSQVTKEESEEMKKSYKF